MTVAVPATRRRAPGSRRPPRHGTAGPGVGAAAVPTELVADPPEPGSRWSSGLLGLFTDPGAGRTRDKTRRRGLTKLLDWLQRQPGDTWQDRWLASGADARRVRLD